MFNIIKLIRCKVFNRHIPDLTDIEEDGHILVHHCYCGEYAHQTINK